MLTVNDLSGKYLAFIIISFLISAAIIPFILKICLHLKLYDRIDERKIHNGNISRLGGVAIFCGFLIPYFFLKDQMNVGFDVNIYICACILAFLTGFVDDIKHIPARYKLFFQVITGILVVFSGLTFSGLSFMINQNEITVFQNVMTVLWVILFMNAINLLDGMDGLASGIVLIANAFIFIMSVSNGNIPVAVLTSLMAGAIFGFFIFNYPPARIFMGDGGAYFLGFMYATITLMGLKKTSVATLFLVPLILLLVPLGDIAQVIFKRIRMGYNIFIADKNHIHHRMMAIGLSTKRIIIVLYIITTILGLSSLIMLKIKNEFSYVLFGVIFLMMFLLMYILNSAEIIVKKNKNIKTQTIENRRKFVRLNKNNFIRIRKINSDHLFCEGCTFNFTPMGLLFFTKQTFRENDIIEIEFYIINSKNILLSSEKPVKLVAKISWTAPFADNWGHLYGCQITLTGNYQDRFLFTDYYFNEINDLTKNSAEKKEKSIKPA